MSLQISPPLERALLLGAGNSATELKAILADRFRVEVVTVDESGIDHSGRELERLVQRVNPDLVFTVIPESLRETTRLLKSTKQAASNIPIIVVLETCEPDQIVELLAAGAVDFVTLPLRAPDVLPRAWKYV